MRINKNLILQESLEFFNSELAIFPYLKNVGEHYRLLKHLSSQYNGINIIDAGTCQGHSCLALAQNPKNKVITYDIERKFSNVLLEYNNIEFRNLDINKEDEAFIKACNLILLDIDPHNGIQETLFIKKLKEINYKGYVICDDINLNAGMKKFWNSVEIEKYDVTEVGHFSGTGIINFNEDGNFAFE